ncbi:unnamed protein product [Gadus morhua 'NCC']
MSTEAVRWQSGCVVSVWPPRATGPWAGVVISISVCPRPDRRCRGSREFFRLMIATEAPLVSCSEANVAQRPYSRCTMPRVHGTLESRAMGKALEGIHNITASKQHVPRVSGLVADGSEGSG